MTYKIFTLSIIYNLVDIWDIEKENKYIYYIT